MVSLAIGSILITRTWDIRVFRLLYKELKNNYRKLNPIINQRFTQLLLTSFFQSGDCIDVSQSLPVAGRSEDLN